MRLLITGVCGFVGSRLAHAFADRHPDWEIFGFDNFIRPGSRFHRGPLERVGVSVLEQDLRDRELASRLPAADWVIDCAANPSVLAGLSDASPSRDMLDHNLVGTIHLLEYCKRHRAGLVLVSTSRVYSTAALCEIPCSVQDAMFRPDLNALRGTDDEAGQETLPGLSEKGITERGIAERFSTQPPLSLYGVSKRASELLAQEYAHAFDFRLWINRCGVMAGAGQFGRADQGIVAYWIHSLRALRPLAYVGFDGLGHQVRDCLHPDDLADLIHKQIVCGNAPDKPQVCNVSGGIESAFSLRQLTEWCVHRWPDLAPAALEIGSDFQVRPFDCPWIVLDSGVAKLAWGWRPAWTREAIWTEVAEHAEQHPDWLDICQ